MESWGSWTPGCATWYLTTIHVMSQPSCSSTDVPEVGMPQFSPVWSGSDWVQVILTPDPGPNCEPQISATLGKCACVIKLNLQDYPALMLCHSRDICPTWIEGFYWEQGKRCLRSGLVWVWFGYFSHAKLGPNLNLHFKAHMSHGTWHVMCLSSCTQTPHWHFLMHIHLLCLFNPTPFFPLPPPLSNVDKYMSALSGSNGLKDYGP